jgi:hypothetical protein
MPDDKSEAVRLALLEHEMDAAQKRLESLESDRKWVISAAFAAIMWVFLQLVPLIPTMLKGAGK